jgi:hypothetical protein
MAGPYMYAAYSPGAQLHTRMIPPHKYGPPERCYYEQVTDHPGFVVHAFGQGKAVYIPWLPGALFHRQGHTNTVDFCASLLQDIAGLAPLGGNLPPQVEVTLFEKSDASAVLLHLVNGSGHFGNSFYAPVPMTDLQVAVPCPQRPKAAHGLRAGRAYDHTWAEGQLNIYVPRLELFEAVRIEIGDSDFALRTQYSTRRT